MTLYAIALTLLALCVLAGCDTPPKSKFKPLPVGGYKQEYRDLQDRGER